MAALPPEIRAEMEQNQDLMRRNLGEEVQSQPSASNAAGGQHASAEPIDNASFIASIQDPNVRRDILENMEDAELQSMPLYIINEARGYRRERERLLRDRQR